MSPKDGKLAIEEGQTIKFSTTATGYPIPISTVSLKFNDGSKLTLENSDRITITKSGSNVTVTIKNAKKSDEGIYEVSYINSGGYATTSLFVAIIEKPTQS